VVGRVVLQIRDGHSDHCADSVVPFHLYRSAPYNPRGRHAAQPHDRNTGRKSRLQHAPSNLKPYHRHNLKDALCRPLSHIRASHFCLYDEDGHRGHSPRGQSVL